MLSIEGWINGLSATIGIVFSLILGLGIIYEARKLKVKLLFYMGLGIFFLGFFWIVECVDFISIMATGNNVINSNNWLMLGIFSWMWSPIIVIISIYVFSTLVLPNIKKYIMTVFVVLGILYELSIILFPYTSLIFIGPKIPGSSLADVSIADYTLGNNLLFMFMISGIILCGFGYLYKGIQSKGVIQKKYYLLSIGFFMFSTFPLIFNLIFPGDKTFIIIIRAGMIGSFIFFYYGLREESEEKIRPKKQITVQDSLFRLVKVPEINIEDESDWRNSIQYLFVVRKAGVPVFSQDLYEGRKNKPALSDELLGGALSGICTLVKELVNNEQPLKVIKQIGYNILLEEGDTIFVALFSIKELKIIRRKLEAFLNDFEERFQDSLNKKIQIIIQPDSVKELVEKHFG
jgi:hypothetical protein